MKVFYFIQKEQKRIIKMDRKINAIGKTDKFGQKWMRCDACKNWEVIQGLHYKNG